MELSEMLTYFLRTTPSANTRCVNIFAHCSVCCRFWQAVLGPALVAAAEPAAVLRGPALVAVGRENAREPVPVDALGVYLLKTVQWSLTSTGAPRTAVHAVHLVTFPLRL